jgi:hypothetical protein
MRFRSPQMLRRRHWRHFFLCDIVLSALHQLASTCLLPVTVCSPVLPRSGEDHIQRPPLSTFGDRHRLLHGAGRRRHRRPAGARQPLTCLCSVPLDCSREQVTSIDDMAALTEDPLKEICTLKPVAHQILNLPQVSLDRLNMNNHSVLVLVV